MGGAHSRKHVRVARDRLLSRPLLDLVRHPSSVANHDRGLLRTQLNLVRKVKSELRLLGVVAGLSNQQQTELAALVGDIDEAYEYWSIAGGPRVQRLKKLGDRGPGHIRFLAEQLENARASLTNVRARARKLDEDISERVDLPVQRAIAEIVTAHRQLIPPPQTPLQYVTELPRRVDSALRHTPTSDPRRAAAVRLVGYYAEAKTLTVDEAHVRTAIIGNARWDWTEIIGQNAFDKPTCDSMRKLVMRSSKAKKPSRPSGPSTSQRTPKK